VIERLTRLGLGPARFFTAEAQRTLRTPMNQLCDLGVSALNHLAGLSWNLAGRTLSATG